MRVMAVIKEAPLVERIRRHLRCWHPRPPSQAPPADRDAWPVNGQIPLTYCPLPDMA